MENVQRPRAYRYLDIMSASFAVVLIIYNITSVKIAAANLPIVGFKPFDAVLLIFPLTYIPGDVLSEVYGFKTARRVIMTSFILQFMAVVVFQAVSFLPPAHGWNLQTAYDQILGLVPRIALASLVAYFFGEMTNSWVLIRLKELTDGRHKWVRFLGSTVVAEVVDTALFYSIAFLGIWPLSQLLEVALASYVVKVLCEVPVLPLSYRLSAWLERAEAA